MWEGPVGTEKCEVTPTCLFLLVCASHLVHLGVLPVFVCLGGGRLEPETFCICHGSPALGLCSP